MDKKGEGLSVKWFGCFTDYGIASFLSKAHNFKFPWSRQIQNYWLKPFATDQMHIIKKIFNVLK